MYFVTVSGGESDIENLQELKEFYDWRNKNNNHDKGGASEAAAHALAVILHEGECGRGAEAIREAIAKNQVSSK